MNQKELLPASAYILVGGKSRRFGSPKWKSKLGGITLLERSLNLCTSLFTMTKIVGKSVEELDGKPVIQDIIKVQAPLVGVYTALKQTSHQWNYIISCDLPLVTEEIILKLWEIISDNFDVVLPCTDNGLEPTCGFYSQSALPECEKMIWKGDYSLHHFIGSLNHKVVDFSPKTSLFLNINTKEDLKKAAKQILIREP